ncbi:MAG: hypothetical protein HY928_16310 [Elusimicrobia bacterium]|nr:hypothetical protein [Elusimicrobiota bacterium]
MERKRWTFEVSFGRREVVALAALALVALKPGALSTEQLTMTTYYPSPYGVYDQMRATNNTFLAYTGGSVGVGTTAPPGGVKFNVAGAGNTSQFDGRVGVGGTYTDTYGTGISVTNRNVHVQGNESGSWLRVGDAWSMNGIYSESGDVVVGAQSGRVRIGSNDTQYLANSCRWTAYTFGTTDYCPNGGLGWSALAYTATSGRIEGGAIPTTGFMYCCKIQQY